MKRNMLLKIINPVILILFIPQAFTALFRDHISLKTFEILHEGGGTILICLIAAHIILNFNWIKVTYLKMFSRNA